MEEELKNIFDDITKRIQEEEDNTIAKAFTMYIGDLLMRNGIKPILIKVEMPYEECLNKNEYQFVSRYGYIFERLDTSDHDKQIIKQTIDKCIQTVCSMGFENLAFNDVKMVQALERLKESEE